MLIGHVEVPHTRRRRSHTSAVPAPPSDPDNLAALKRAGFHVATLAGNHIFDAGPDGIEETIATLRHLGIATTEAGMRFAEARELAVLARQGLRVGTLSYNCVGPKESWADEQKAGCAYVQVITHYELDHAAPGGPPRIYTVAEPESTDAMLADIENLRREADVLIVVLHKGIGHTPAVLAMYQRPLAKAAIDAGADIVVVRLSRQDFVELYELRSVLEVHSVSKIAGRSLAGKDLERLQALADEIQALRNELDKSGKNAERPADATVRNGGHQLPYLYHEHCRKCSGSESLR